MPHKNQVMLLQLAAAQLALSLAETERPFNDLTKMFLDIIERHRQMEQILISEQAPDLQRLRQLHQDAEAKVKSSVVDFQFYDRMTQRLNHIMANIQHAIDILRTSGSTTGEDEWQQIFSQIEKSYTMQEERELYASIKSGEGFESAVERLIEKTRQNEDVGNDIELF